MLHFKALLWKNLLLWRRKIFGSLCELLTPILMVGIIIGIRKAASSVAVHEGNRVKDGVGYITEVSEGGFYDQIKQQIFNQRDFLNFPVNPKGADYYALLGEDPQAVQDLNKALDMFLGEIGQETKRKFIYMEDITTEEELFQYVRRPEYSIQEKDKKLLFAIGLPSDKVNNPYDYTIYMSENFPADVPSTRSPKTTTVPGTTDFMRYSRLGFMSLQSFIANYILKSETKSLESSIDIFMSMGSVDEFRKDDFWKNFGPTLALFMLIIFIAPVFRLVSFLTEEKASRAREGMKIMGLKDAPYWLSWFVYYFSVNFVISLFTGISFSLVLFPNSSMFLIFLWVFLYGLSLFSFGVLVSSFLQRPLIACIIVTIFHFLTYFFVIPLDQPGVQDQTKIVFSAIPNIAMTLAAGALGDLETAGLGLTKSTIFNNTGHFKIGVSLISFGVNFLVQLLLGLYLDNVLPKEFGKRQHPCFMFKKSFWFGAEYKDGNGLEAYLLQEEHEDFDQNEDNICEQVPPNVKQLEATGDCMKVRHLKKVYSNGKVAVDDLSLTMYKNQIFALLGHNGAGKTTTLSILTGLYQPSAGKASVFNMDMFEQADEVRKNLGVCPQFDILFDMLTPEEHLKLYCMFKGVPASEVEAQVEKTLSDVDLQSKRGAYAKDLSGGQKRKLSVGIAMIGGSKLVLLDEPTSGMDLTARRKIWDMLKSNKQDRILILTTHFMDEADILGDRIGIMVAGKIKCCGGSLFLKKQFGVGYNLVVAKEDNQPNPDIEEFIFRRLNHCVKLSEVSSEVTFQIPQSESVKFEEFFTELDNSLEKLQIKSYGVGVTTLEEVFLKVGEQDEEEKPINLNRTFRINDSELGYDDDYYSIAEESEQNVFFTHLYALCVKRFLMSFRKLKSSLLEIFIPMVFILTGLGLSKIDYFVDSSPIDLGIGLFPGHHSMYISSTQEGQDLEAFANSFDSDIFGINVIETPVGDTLYQTLSNFEETVFLEDQGYEKQMSNVGNFVLHKLQNNRKEKVCQVFGFSNGFARDGAPMMTQSVLKSCLRVLLNRPEMQLKFVNMPFPLTARAKARAEANNGAVIAFLFAIAFAMIPTGIAASIVHEREINVKHQQMISGASSVPYWLSNYIIDFTRSLIPLTFAISMIFIFDVTLPFIWIHILLFGLALPPFTYALTFLFKKESAAQLMTILINIFLGGFIPIVIILLQSMSNTREIGKSLRWLPRIFPPFAVIDGIVQISIMNTIAFALGEDPKDNPLSIDVAGGDAVFLAISIFFWWSLFILLESNILMRIFRFRGVKDYKEFFDEPQVEIDSDVRNEEFRCSEVVPQNCSVLVNQLRKEFKVQGQQFAAVKNICFGLEYGECFALLGVNGAGKSTTFKSMTGDVTPTDGKIYIDGLDLSHPSEFEKARKLIGYCPQENAIFEGMTVYEHLVFYSRIKGILKQHRHQIIEDTLRELDLDSFRDVRCEKLSGGNKRKLSVAMAIIGNPPIVFLDEPSTGMDPKAKRFMWSVISKISTLRKKSTIILTTHSMEEAEALCTKMGIMVSGRFKCFGSPQAIKDKFGTGYEIEIKVRWPSEQEATKLLKEKGLDGSTNATALAGLKSNIDFISESELDLGKYSSEMTPLSLCQLHLLNEQYQTLKASLEEASDSCSLVEHCDNFFRFRVFGGGRRLGFYFGLLEKLKSKASFEEYGISQTTLEQIFNGFAKEANVDEK
ncbi:unnamed protein product [Moneuplotes crassus]|uniref:ABC transporter domain-containing protein n=1 Tax=Euplotes crassus TaxID=5936 RepID=A0AAD1Y0T1_EUPCR|nr:unnamed protein product [Moneuplotes crassus]